ncbi:hypothetical protein A1O1_03974 [Capronia coronata CBS 617.96]|uniref:Transcription factor domain-containing protein n=1 Tax=Capronia coronata CBS 617.96 TaxID=1182541 RepID=W9Z8Q5_9EURO|nr:uncharacterized protein A1O1_03974 [Capronia coronata CBS 617.96]EXJ90869.1 hypothetical protein A1O1_03974 [Capronia coronata CBS 617.96]
MSCWGGKPSTPNNDTLQVACWGRPPLLRHTDFDVKPPTSEDFEIPDTQSSVFIQVTMLCTIMTSISEVYMQRQHIQQAELTSIDVALCDWVKSLPDDLKLYNANGRRLAYYRPVSEMYIQYFVAIVMSQMLRHKERDRPWRTSIPSRLAASCATALYDEIYCREDTVYLLPNHGFFCLAISLPLLCHRPQSDLRREMRKSEIAVIRSVLNSMRDRYGDASMVLGKMEKLHDTIERSSRSNESPDATLSEIQGACIHAKELFPFPTDFCSDMSLLELVAATDPDQQAPVTDYPPLPDEHTENTLFGYSFVDLFELELPSFNFMEGDESPFTFHA